MLIRYNDDQNLSPFPILCNQGPGEVFSNVRENLSRGYEKFVEAKANTGRILICGSGPSLMDTLESIRAMKKRGAFVLALNGAARFLYEQGIQPDAMAMVDSRQGNTEFVEKAWAPEAWLASQCHPDVTAKAEAVGMKVVLWHPGVPGIQPHIPAAGTTLKMGGGYTIGLCAMSCAFVAGFREIHLFGYDSSHREDKGHAFQQDLNLDDDLVDVVIENRRFTGSTVMAAQISRFLEFSSYLLKDGCELHVHGDGALPYLWKVERRKGQIRRLTAVYDLGVSPPTYEFISFLVEAERYRIANNFDVLDVTFQPGPMHGFRSDYLPPDVATRRGMLWRVCVGIARLLPSVRNISVLSERAPVAGDVFPVGWVDNVPTSHYGMRYLKDGFEMLQASEAAKSWVGKMKFRYATITLRQSAYWPERNSNIYAWNQVAGWLSAQGIYPVFIPDVDTALDTQWISKPEAATDVDLRAALYEGAVINLGVSNGPMYLCPFLKARYIIFKMGDGRSPATTTEFLLAHGVARGDENPVGGNGKLIWEPDTADVIIRELQEFAVQRKEKTS